MRVKQLLMRLVSIRGVDREIVNLPLKFSEIGLLVRKDGRASRDEHAVCRNVLRGLRGIAVVDVAGVFGGQLDHPSTVEANGDGTVFGDSFNRAEGAFTNAGFSIRFTELNTVACGQVSHLFTVDRALCRLALSKVGS